MVSLSWQPAAPGDVLRVRGSWRDAPLHAERAPDLDARIWYPACSGCSQVPGFRALPKHPREDKAAVVALAGVQGWTARGARLRKGGFGRGTGSFHGNVLGEERRERDKARSLLAGPREPGWKIPREEVVVLCWVLCHTLFSVPTLQPTASPAPRMRCNRWLLETGLVTTRTGMTPWTLPCS